MVLPRKLVVHVGLILVALFFLSTQTLFAQDAHEADRQQLLGMLESIELAINNDDPDSVLQFLHEDVNVIYQNAEVADGTDAVMAFYEKLFTGDSALLSDISTEASVGAPAEFYGNTVVAYGSGTDTVTFTGGKEVSVPIVWSVTLVKEGDEWKIVSMHISANAFDNPFVSISKNLMIMIGAGGLIIGFLVGFFVNRRKRQTI